MPWWKVGCKSCSQLTILYHVTHIQAHIHTITHNLSGGKCCVDSTESKLCVGLLLSHVQLFVTPWTVAHQAPLSMEFSRQEYWSGLDWTWVSCIAGRFFTNWTTREAYLTFIRLLFQSLILWLSKTTSNFTICREPGFGLIQVSPSCSHGKVHGTQYFGCPGVI